MRLRHHDCPALTPQALPACLKFLPCVHMYLYVYIHMHKCCREGRKELRAPASVTSCTTSWLLGPPGTEMRRSSALGTYAKNVCSVCSVGIIMYILDRVSGQSWARLNWALHWGFWRKFLRHFVKRLGQTTRTNASWLKDSYLSHHSHRRPHARVQIQHVL